MTLSSIVKLICNSFPFLIPLDTKKSGASDMKASTFFDCGRVMVI